MHTAIRFALSISALMISTVCAASSLAIPERDTTIVPVPAEEIHKSIDELNDHIGSYPPAISSTDQRKAVYAKWARALQQAWLIDASAPGAERPLSLLAELYRQGHNLDVERAGAEAIRIITQCLSAFPSSKDCHLSAAYFYLSIDPKFAPKGEASLLWLRDHFKPKVDFEVERGLVFAYIYQGRTQDALKQCRYLLTQNPKAEKMSALCEALGTGKVRVQQE